MTIRRTHVIIDAVKRASRARYEILGRRGRQSRRRGTRQIAASTPHINKNYNKYCAHTCRCFKNLLEGLPSMGARLKSG